MAILWRLAFPLMFILAPRVIPRLVRTVYLVWKLYFDHRVPLLLKLLPPATIIYFLTPFARVPVVGLAGYLVVLAFAIFLFLNLSPREVVERYAPWRARTGSTSQTEQDRSRVVEGSFRLKDDEPTE